MMRIQIEPQTIFELIRMTHAVANQRPTKSEADAQGAARRSAPSEQAMRDMSGFNYGVEAELFPTRNRKSKRVAFGYRRFARASEAIRFAVEELPSDALAGAYLEVHEKRFDRHGILRLYESDAYPLARRTARS